MNELIERNKNINRGYRKLIVWKEAIGLYVFVSKKLKDINDVSFKIKNQVEDSVFLVHSNIAEGYGRRSLKENINFNNYALGSLAENYSQVYALLKAEKIDRIWFDVYDSKHFSLENKLIAYNKSQIKILNKKGDWKNDYIIREDEEEYN
jgi:four helix bundle protein